MSYVIFTDACSNLPNSIVSKSDIRLLPCGYTMDGEYSVYTGDLDRFDSHAFYDKLRTGSTVKTSLLNSQLFIDKFAPELEKGLDVIYIGLSSGVSGTFQASKMAAEDLMEKFSGRTVRCNGTKQQCMQIPRYRFATLYRPYADSHAAAYYAG